MPACGKDCACHGGCRTWVRVACSEAGVARQVLLHWPEVRVACNEAGVAR